MVFVRQHTIERAVDLRRDVVAHNRVEFCGILMCCDVPFYLQRVHFLEGSKGVGPCDPSRTIPNCAHIMPDFLPCFPRADELTRFQHSLHGPKSWSCIKRERVNQYYEFDCTTDPAELMS